MAGLRGRGLRARGLRGLLSLTGLLGLSLTRLLGLSLAGLLGLSLMGLLGLSLKGLLGRSLRGGLLGLSLPGLRSLSLMGLLGLLGDRSPGGPPRGVGLHDSPAPYLTTSPSSYLQRGNAKLDIILFFLVFFWKLSRRQGKKSVTRWPRQQDEPSASRISIALHDSRKMEMAFATRAVDAICDDDEWER